MSSKLVEKYGIFEKLYSFGSEIGANEAHEAVGDFTHASGTRVSVHGFRHDNNHGRVRFMPTLQGSWSYVISRNGAELSSGAFVAGHAACHGPLRTIESFPYHFQQADGSPFYLMGVTAYNAVTTYRHNRAALLEFLDYYSSRRFNWFRFFLEHTTWPSPTGDSVKLASGRIIDLRDPKTDLVAIGLEGESFEGDVIWPWAGTDREPDWSGYNRATFDEAEGVICEIARRGAIASVIIFHPYDAPFVLMGDRRFEICKGLIREAVARLGARWNVVWCIANEWQRGQRFTFEEMDELGRYLREVDPYQHLISCHHYSRFEFAREAWSTMSCMQHRGTPAEINRYMLQNRHFGKPVVNEEYGYEGDNHLPPNDSDNVRHDHWALAMAGGYGTYGDKTKGPKLGVYFGANLRDAAGTRVPD